MTTSDPACFICRQVGGTKRPVRLFVTWISSEWSGIILKIVEQANRCGHSLVVCDLTKRSYPRVSVSLTELLRPTNAVIIQLRRGRKSPLNPATKYMKGNSDWLLESVTSELRTKYRGKLPKFLGWLESIESYIVSRRSRHLYLDCLAMVEDSNEVWIYPNGRYSAQRAVLEAALELGLKTLCYERSRFPDRAFIRPYRVHDRKMLQRDVERLGAQVSVEAKFGVERWASERSNPVSGTNPFAARFETKSNFDFKSTSLRAVFFSSSRDELEGLGSMWTHFEWSDQYEAFRTVGKYLLQLGFECELRLHPNLANKSARDIREEHTEVLKLRELGFRIIGPHSRTNSYDLAKSADLVVVSRSTIGIESLSMGIPVSVTSNSFYDQVPGILRIESGSGLLKIEEYLKRFDPQFAAVSGSQWLGVQWDLDPEMGNRFTVQPRKLQSFANALHPNVIYYYVSRAIISLVDWVPRKILLRKLRNISM